MPICIVHDSERLCTFLDQSGRELYYPRRRHIINVADALLVKTVRSAL